MKKFLLAAKLILAAVIMGLICGTAGSIFSKSVAFVTELRMNSPWLLYLLPIAGILTVLIYKLLGVTGENTNRVIESVRTEKRLSLKLFPAIFVSSLLTHLCGGSAGKEGAALQLGGSIASPVSRILKLDEEARHTVVMCGMAALFSAVFGTPFGAFIFALEVVCVGKKCIKSAAFVLLSSLLSFVTAQLLHTHAEHFDVGGMPEITVMNILKFAAVCVAGALVGMLFWRSLHFFERAASRLFKNGFVRIFIGALLIVLLTVVLGTTDYNGGGMHIIENIFETGEVRYEAFILKLLFTVITVSAGFKGGEIVPTLFIGASLGAALGMLMGASVGFCAALGMVTLFSSMTNCPIASAVLAVELFGVKGIVFYAFASAVGFLLSGKGGLYEISSKYKEN